MEFNKQEIKDIAAGKNTDWTRIGDPSGYGSVWRSPKNPGKVVKIQVGDYATYDNEISKQFEAYIDGPSQHFEVPKLGDTGFFPEDDFTRSVKGTSHRSPSSSTDGWSYIEMDEADFAYTKKPTRRQKLASHQGLIDLYRRGVHHSDTHPGNIKYNPKTDKAVILDYALADKASLTTDAVYKRAHNAVTAIRESGNNYFADLFMEDWGEKNNDLEGATQSGDKKAQASARSLREDIVRQAEDVALRVGPDVDPINLNESGINLESISKSEAPVEVVKQGAQPMDMDAMHARLDKAMAAATTPTPFRAPGHFAGIRRHAGSIWNNMSPLKAGLTVGAVDLIPSAEVIKTGEKHGLGAALRRQGREVGEGMAYGVGAGALTMAAPALALPITAAGGGMLLHEGVRSLNEATRVITGDSLQSKLRQTLGTEKRTGNVESSADEKFTREMARINNPDLVQITARDPKKDTAGQVKDAPVPDLAHRLRLAGQRFNPSKGEFGITELLFGR